MTWEPRIVEADGKLVAAPDKAAAAATLQSSTTLRPRRKRRTADQKLEAEILAILTGASRLSIDSLLWRSVKERMLILNEVAAELASLADRVVMTAQAVSSDYEIEPDFAAWMERAIRLHDDFGRLLNYGRIILEEHDERRKSVSVPVNRLDAMDGAFHDLARMSAIVFRSLSDINDAAAKGIYDGDSVDQAAMLARLLDEMVCALKAQFMSLQSPGDEGSKH